MNSNLLHKSSYQRGKQKHHCSGKLLLKTENEFAMIVLKNHKWIHGSLQHQQQNLTIWEKI